MNQSNDTGASAQMPEYIGHKRVWALFITSLERLNDGGARLTFREKFAPKTVDADWVNTRRPQAGGYFITYALDGYTTYSPRDPFEKGYTPAAEWGIRYAQEPKYKVNDQGRLANRYTGIAIPDEEPVITFRAKDSLLPAVLRFYASNLPEGRHRDDIEAQLRRVEAFQLEHATYVRMPD